MAGRVLQAIPSLLIISIFAFLLLSATRIDPAHEAMTRQSQFVSPEALRIKRHELGLDRPLPLRYGRWLVGLAHLDFGYSFANQRPVAQLLRERLPATALLASTSLGLALVISVPLGVAAAVGRQNRAFDLGVRLLAIVAASVPGFALGLALIWLFAARLHWLPAFGGPSARGLVLPAIALTVPQAGLLVRLSRASVLDVVGQDFVRVARAKGLSGFVVAARHVTPNALVPVLTVVGLSLADLFSGAFVIEYVFAWNGIGRLAVGAVQAGDMPVVMAYVLFVAVVFLVLNLGVDLLYGALDPRLRAGRSET